MKLEEIIANISYLTLPLGFIALEVFYQLRGRLIKKHKDYDTTLRSEDFTILVPLWGKIEILAKETLEVLIKNKDKVIILTNTTSSEAFYKHLDDLGLKYIQFVIEKRPNPWKLFKEYFLYYTVNTKYTIFLDADSFPVEEMQVLIGNAEANKYDIASTNVVAWNQSNIIEYLQNIEYTNAMIARRVYPWLTSGACVIGRTQVLKEIFKTHTCFNQGGDIEIGKKAHSMGYNVGHLSCIVMTYVPSTIKKWIKQRGYWMSGTFRHTIMNMFFEIWKFPMFFVYSVIVTYLLFPFRFYGFLHLTALLYIIPIYWIIMFTFNWKYRSWKLLLAPIYDLFQIMIITPIGVYRYIQYVIEHKNIGIIRNK